MHQSDLIARCRQRTGIPSLLSILLSISLALFLIDSCYSQVPELKFKYFGREDGLNNSHIREVLQDTSGFIWIATREGLFRYDGYSFFQYRSRQGDSSSINNNNINTLYVDTRGRLWIGSNQGICVYDENKDCFRRIAETTKDAGISGLNVIQLGEDMTGKILASNGESLYRLNEATGKFSPLCTLDTGQINRFLVLDKQNILLGCTQEKGLLKLTLPAGTPEHVDMRGVMPADGKGLNVSDLAREGDDVWLASLGQGIQKLALQSGKLTAYPYNNKDDANCTNVYIDRDHRVWISDYTGLKILDRTSGSFVGYYPNPALDGSIKANVKGFIQDRQGNFWVNHEPGGIGISYLRRGFGYFDNTSGAPWTSSSANITAVNEDARGNLWLGFYEGGIDVFNWGTGSVNRYKTDEKDAHSTGRGSTLFIFRDSKGTMWSGSYFGGLQYFDSKTGKFIKFLHDEQDSTTIAGNDIRSMAEDSEGRLWVAVHGKGVDCYDREKNRFLHYNKLKNALSNNWTSQLLFDNKDNLWVGTAWGLNVLEKGGSKFHIFVSDINDSLSLSDSYINCLCLDGENTLWVGTSAGLNRFIPSTGKFSHRPDALKTAGISSILADRMNILWIGTLTGLYKFNPITGSINSFRHEDGLQSEEFNLRSAYTNTLNELFWGSTKGLLHFKPDQLVYNNEAPYVYIDRLKIHNREITLSDTGILSLQLRKTKSIWLKETDDMLTFGFTALNLITPVLNQYSYKLEGFDKNWSPIGTEREVTYTNLDPGIYNFRVRACNNDGIWNEKGASLLIHIRPPWYQTLWFKGLLALLLSGSIFGLIYLRTRVLQNQKQLLEQAVQEQTTELFEKNELLRVHAANMDEINRLLVDRQQQLELQSEELKNQSESLELTNLRLQQLVNNRDKIFSVISHDLSSPFHTILGFSELLLSRYNTLRDDEKLHYTKTIHDSSERLHTLLQNLLLWAQSQTRGITCNPERVPVRKILEEITALRKESAASKQISLQLNCNEDIKVYADLEMTQTIFRNLLSNAIKFTPAGGRISLDVAPEETFVRISFTNSGEGIPEARIEKLLSSDILDPESGTDGERGSGLGLNLCKYFIRRNKGSLHISSTEGKSTTFAVDLPLA